MEQRSYEIQADIVDIRQDVPSSEDIFFVDTNVWYLLTYPKADLPELSRRSRPKRYQIEHYPKYLEDTAEAEAKLYCSGLSLSELAHNIEKIECEIAHGQGFSLKQFRRDYPEERAQFVEEIESSWAQVTSFAEILPLEIDASITEAALNRLSGELIDGYDLFILETMKTHGITKVITDDGDYATVSGLQVFTANRNVINAARSIIRAFISATALFARVSERFSEKKTRSPQYDHTSLSRPSPPERLQNPLLP